MTLDLGCWLDESAVESPESRVEETRVEEMTQIERFEDIEAWKHARIRDQGVGIRVSSGKTRRRQLWRAGRSWMSGRRPSVP